MGEGGTFGSKAFPIKSSPISFICFSFGLIVVLAILVTWNSSWTLLNSYANKE